MSFLIHISLNALKYVYNKLRGRFVMASQTLSSRSFVAVEFLDLRNVALTKDCMVVILQFICRAFRC